MMTSPTLRRGALLVATLLAACGGAEPAPEAPEALPSGTIRLSDAQMRAAGIASARMESTTIRQPVRVPGSVQSPDTAQVAIGSVVEGRVVTVHVLPGDAVRKGQPLVEIHSHELASAERDLSAAEAERTFRSNALERSEKLFQAGAVSLEEVERRRADFQAADAELVRATEMVEHLNPSSRGNVTAVAPRSGTVFMVHAKPGEAVLPGTPLLEMGSTDALWVTAFVPENTSSALAVGDEVTVRFRSVPGLAVSARLIRASDFVDPTNRSVEMRFALNSIPEGVRPGSFAIVDVTTSEAFQGVELSEDAAVRMGEEDVVFVVESPGVFRAVNVVAVPVRDGHVAVRGLPADAEIVTQGAYFLKAALEVSAGAETGDGA
ncbi:MAG: efflux RND transporter periplasmic adaptor subunit [Gemmatimonadota bacterium]